jgi:hypothetical protein
MIISAQMAQLTLPPFVILMYLLVCPGMAYIRLIHLQDLVTELVLALTLSITLMTILSEGMALTAHWSAWWGMLLIIGLSWVGALWQIRQTKRTSHSLHTS